MKYLFLDAESYFFFFAVIFHVFVQSLKCLEYSELSELFMGESSFHFRARFGKCKMKFYLTGERAFLI